MSTEQTSTVLSGYKFPTEKLRTPRTEKKPLVLVACGSYSPVTYMHLRLNGALLLFHFTLYTYYLILFVIIICMNDW